MAQAGKNVGLPIGAALCPDVAPFDCRYVSLRITRRSTVGPESAPFAQSTHLSAFLLSTWCSPSSPFVNAVGSDIAFLTLSISEGC